MAPTGTASKTKATKTTEDRKVTDTAVTYVRQTGERAVDVPVGAVLTARDRVNGAVQPWTRSETRGEELKGLREQVKGELGKFERRGGQARRKTTDRVRHSRTRLEERVRKAGATVKESPSRVGDGLSKARASVQQRVSSSPAS